MQVNNWRRDVRLSAGFAESLSGLYQAADSDQLRVRLSHGLANLGFWGVCDCVSAQRVDATYFDSRRHNWDKPSDLWIKKRNDATEQPRTLSVVSI